MGLRLAQRVMLLLAFLWAFGSCSALLSALGRRLEKPRLEFDSATVEDLSLQGLSLRIVFRVFNPNAMDLSLVDVDYTLHVEEVKVASMRPEAGLHLPAQSTVLLPFLARVEYSSVGRMAQALWTKGFATFRAEGVLGLQTPVGILKLPLSKTGVFEWPRRENTKR